MAWKQNGQRKDLRTAGEGPGSQAPKREGKIGPWGRLGGGHFHKRPTEEEVLGQVFCGWQRTGGQKKADPSPPSAHCPSLKVP